MNTIPVIDLAGFAAADGAVREATARKLGSACREIGFFGVTGHGIPEAAIAGMFAASRRFFAEPVAAKEALAIERLGNNRGYVGIAVEKLDENKPGDLKEAFNLHVADPEAAGPPDSGHESVWPAIPGWQAQISAYADACFALGRAIHRAVAIDLGLAEDFFDTRLRRHQTLRLLHYPPLPADAARGQVAAGEHTDYGTVTILATDGVPGLQVRRRDGVWIEAPALADAFICNIGDCLMRWTNDVYRSTPHRVAMRAGDRDRYSVPFFMGAKAETVVTPLASCIAPGARPLYPPISAGDYLQQRLNETYPHLQKAG